MLSKKVLAEKVALYIENKAALAEIEARLKELEDVLKNEMVRKDVEELVVGKNVVRYTSYTQSRFDTSGFKKVNPEMYAEFQKSVSGHRFSVT